MLTTPLKKRVCHRKQKMKSFGNHEEFLARIAKSLYYVQLPLSNCTSLPVTELAAEIFSQTNKFSLNRLDIEKAAEYTRNGCVSPCLLVLALLYLERLKASNPKYLTKVSPTELFLISLVVGSKFLQDDGEEEAFNNTDWADLTGLSVQEINKAEKEFLDAINWEVFVGEDEFWKRFNSLESNVGLRQGRKRGWFTYTELNLLLQLIDLSNVIQCLWNVTSACLLSYTASVLALVGSALLVGQIPGLELRSKVPTSAVSSGSSSTASSEDWTNSSSPSPAAVPDVALVCDRVTFPVVVDPSSSYPAEPDYANLSDCGRRPSPTRSVQVRVPGTGPGLESGSSDDSTAESNLLRQLYLNFWSRTGFVDVDHLLPDKWRDSGFTGKFNVWLWSDYIKNLFVKDTIPRGLYMVASF